MSRLPRLAAALLCGAVLPTLAPPAHAARADRALIVDRASLGGRCDDARRPARVNRRRPLCSLERAVMLSPDGGRILLREATYPKLVLDGAQPAATLRIRPYRRERPALEGVNLERSARLSFESLRLTGLTEIRRSEWIAFVGNDVTPHGFVADEDRHLLFARNHVHDLTIAMRPAGPDEKPCNRFSDGAGVGPHCGYGFRLMDSADVVVTGNEIDHVPADALQGTGMTRLEISNNHFHDISPFIDPAEHADAIQLYRANWGVTIRANRFEDTRGVVVHPVPGDPRWPGPTEGLVVADNTFFRIRHWAMHLVDTANAQITGNTAWLAANGVRLTDYEDTPAQMTGVVLAGNVLSALEGQPSMFAASHDNVIAEGLLPGAADARAVPSFADVEAGDLRLRDLSGVGAPDQTAVRPPRRRRR
jgi:hypothetical protein